MKAYFYMLIPVFAVSVYSYCLFLFISFASAGAAAHYNFFAVFACSALACFVNYRLSMHDQSLIKISIINALLVVLVEFVGFSTHNEIIGPVYYAIAAFFFMAPIICSLMLYQNTIRTNTMLIFCELSIVGTALFMAILLGYFEAPVRAVVLSIICLAFNLYLLSSLRIDAPTNRKVEIKKKIERGVILSMVIVCACFAASAIVIFVLPTTRGAIFSAATAIGQFFTFLGKTIMGFLAWFMELFPDPAPVESDILPAMDSTASGINEFEGVADLPDSVKLIAIVIVAAIILVMILVIVIKLRKTKLRFRGSNITATHEEVEKRDPVKNIFIILFRRLMKRIIFTQRLFTKRYTHEGFFVHLSHIVMRKGFVRAPSETAGAFIERLTPVLTTAYVKRYNISQYRKDFSVVDEDVSWIESFLIGVVKQMDSILYAPVATSQVTFSRDSASQILKAAKKIRKELL